MTADLKAHAGRLRELHHAGEMLVLPNVWDAASAKIVAEAGFPVVATASAAISAMLGYPDGEGAPWQEMFAAAGRVARAVPVPVTDLPAHVPHGMERPGGLAFAPVPRSACEPVQNVGADGQTLNHHAGPRQRPAPADGRCIAGEDLLHHFGRRRSGPVSRLLP
jgi:Phosphoenolpyruvate phosphomutase